jgi:hypothetical protein
MVLSQSLVRAARLLGALVLLVFVAACEGMADLMALQKALTAEYKEPVNVHLTTSGDLTITFVNAEGGSADSTRQRATARRMARFAYRSYPRRDRIRSVTIAFASVSKTGPVSVTRSQGHHTWSATELAGGDEGRPVSFYTAPVH